MFIHWIVLFFPSIQTQSLVSYNHPIFPPSSSWSPTATTFANHSQIGWNPIGLHIDSTDSIYTFNRDNGQILIWSNNSTQIFYSNLSPSARSIFVTVNREIFIGDSGSIKQISPNTTSIINTSSICYGLFVDLNNSLYCSMYSRHRIVRLRLNVVETIAGNGSAGSTANQLEGPFGIFVDTNFDLYVADFENDRVQLFRSGQTNAITVAGGQIIKLKNPSHVILDGKKYVFIADGGNHRIIGSNENGFRCIVSCSGSGGSTQEKLRFPRSLAFDSFGNLFVTDLNNSRIQKFERITWLKFERSREFSIVPDVLFNCTSQWILKNSSNTILIETGFSELFIPARKLPLGVYKLEFTGCLTSLIYIEIIPTNIIPNLVQFGTSMITSGFEQDLKLDPGTYSIDPDEVSFDSKKWIYKYYCRIYPTFNFPNLNGSLLTIEDQRNDPANPSCLTNRTGFRFTNSSLTILSKSLQSNRTYQFMVQMTNIRNSSQQATGYVLIQIQNHSSPIIAIGCVIESLCSPNLEYQFVNPTTQVALFSLCIGNCSSIKSIIWNVYSGEANSSLWILFNQTENYFFGNRSSNFTVTNQLFLQYPNIKFWRFEVVYSFLNQTSTSALHFVLNQPSRNGSCSIFPSNGTTTTLFQISCPNWFDEDGIKDYSLYSFTNQLMIAFSSESSLKVYLPLGENQILFVEIRDQLNCLTKFNLSSISVETDSQLNINLLSTGNQNTVSQLLTSLSLQLNKRNEQNINRAVSNGVPISMISISSLTTQHQPTNSSFNQSALVQFEKELNSQSSTREYLISFTHILQITTSNSIKLQSSSLVQLTKSTNELTRTTISIATDRCFRLTLALQSMSTKLIREDAEICATQLFQCASNLLSAVNGPLQQRTRILDLDENEKNTYQQKELANQIQTKMKEMISRLNSILTIHLNLGQQSIINTSEVFMSLQSETIEFLSNQTFLNGAIQFSPIETNQRKSIRIQSKIEPLASFGNSANTNVSRSISFSLFDSNGNEISLDYPIEILIPRDPNRILPPMILQNVTSRQRLFNLHYVNITTILSISIHIEIEPLNSSVAYLFVYKFDQIPQLNEIDGWSILCPKDFHSFFLDNEQTRNHKSLVFGLRELNSFEIVSYCRNNNSQMNLPITNQKFNFTSNYKLRIYSSGCYFLDENNEWNDRGLRVGNKTNHDQTHCLTDLN